MYLLTRKNKKKSNKDYKHGFTLVETLIAVTILITSLVGPLVVAQKGLISANFARDQVAASYLAGEAVEYIRNKRDENALAGLSWLNGLYSCIDGKCAIDVINDAISACSENCPNLQVDPENGFYGYGNGWVNSIFKREVKISNINDSEVAIAVTVLWKSGILAREFILRENIFDWQ